MIYVIAPTLHIARQYAILHDFTKQFRYWSMDFDFERLKPDDQIVLLSGDYAATYRYGSDIDARDQRRNDLRRSKHDYVVRRFAEQPNV